MHRPSTYCTACWVSDAHMWFVIAPTNLMEIPGGRHWAGRPGFPKCGRNPSPALSLDRREEIVYYPARRGTGKGSNATDPSQPRGRASLVGHLGQLLRPGFSPSPPHGGLQAPPRPGEEEAADGARHGSVRGHRRRCARVYLLSHPQPLISSLQSGQGQFPGKRRRRSEVAERSCPNSPLLRRS